MKSFLPVVVLSTLLVGCSKSADAPAPPSLVGGTWAWSEQDYTTTPKAGTPSRTVHSTMRAYTETYFFEATGGLTIAYNGKPEPRDTYTYSGNTLTFLRPFGAFAFTVQELSAHRLVLAETREDATNRYEQVDTYIR